MAPASFLSYLFDIEKDEVALRQRGRLFQITIVALALVSLLSAVLHLFANGFSIVSAALFLLQLVVTFFIAFFGLFLLRRGRLLAVAHTFFIALNASLLFLAITGSEQSTFFPFLLLISVISLALLHDVRVSMFYFVVFIGIMSGYMISRGGEQWQSFFLTTLGLSAAAWIFAYSLQQEQVSVAARADYLSQQTAELQRRLRQLRLGTEVGQVASASLDLNRLLRETVNLIREQFGFYHAAIYLLDESGNYVVVREATGKVGEVMKEQQHRLAVGSDNLIGQVMKKREPLIASNSERDNSSTHLLSETRSEAALPLVAWGQLLGVLDVQSREADAFQEEDITILRLMGNQVASSMDNARLYSQVQTRLHETEAMFNMISLLATTLDILEIYRRAARALVEQFKLARVTISSWNPDENSLTLHAEFARSESGEALHNFEMLHRTYPLSRYPIRQQALESREPLLYDVHSGEDQAHRKLLGKLHHTAVLIVPLVTGPRILGLVELYQNSDQPEFQEDVPLIQAVTSQIATALSNAQMATEARARAAQMSTINRVSRALSEAPDLASIYESIRREIFSLTEATGLSILLLSEDREHLRWVYAYEYGQELEVSDMPLPISRGFSGYVARTGEVLWINKKFEEMREQYNSFTVGAIASAWLGVPLIVTNELIGVLAVENGDDPQAFSEANVQLLTTVAGPVATAMNNLRQLETIRANQEVTERLYRAGRAINAAPTVRKVLAALVQIDALEAAALTTINLFEESHAPLESKWLNVAAAWQREGKRTLLARKIALGDLPVAGRLRKDEVTLIADIAGESDLETADFFSVTGKIAPGAFAAFPLVAGDTWIGFLGVYWEESYEPGAESVRQIVSLAGQAATAIQNQRLLQRTQEALLAQSEQSVQLQTAAEVSAATSSILDVNELMQRSVELIQERFGLYYVGLLLLDESTDEVVLKAATGEDGQELITRNFSTAVGSRSLIGRATVDGQPRIVQDVTKSAEWKAEALLPETRSEVALPLRVRNQIIGVLSVQSTRINDFPPGLVSVLQTISEQLAIAIDNARLLAEAEARARQQQLLYQVGARLHSSADVETIVEIGLQALSEQLGGSAVKLQLGGVAGRYEEPVDTTRSDPDSGETHEQQ